MFFKIIFKLFLNTTFIQLIHVPFNKAHMYICCFRNDYIQIIKNKRLLKIHDF
ncbi:hypothetical protein HanRHA438_Chr16g0749121 [Helianthus annuus]|uniref:Uncharacterized protein n=1 Tax=Helianthus annuus TaxID=4232 RepID=A0A9K3GWY3_HELAN|nr:hypothetical protein HanXRQr2_Chr16g0736661 [Helianthus annuus]KAJ0441717.1 hypothetical protein HanIR_Chr16g0800961 [Helianthus annuus]KAJ0820299.1 hypothetical protein HanPSC8_Chr16g0706291 [Helianthus annuus]KAJ0834916.1 hypothetical protein HanRHA438_Chr16g0749121 [Helianthus annuus]